MWLLITKEANALSMSGFTSSFTTCKMSNLDKIGSVKSTLSWKEIYESYLPFTGFAAAITVHLACKFATIPALEIDIDYYSMAS